MRWRWVGIGTGVLLVLCLAAGAVLAVRESTQAAATGQERAAVLDAFHAALLARNTRDLAALLAPGATINPGPGGGTRDAREWVAEAAANNIRIATTGDPRVTGDTVVEPGTITVGGPADPYGLPQIEFQGIITARVRDGRIERYEIDVPPQGSSLPDAPPQALTSPPRPPVAWLAGIALALTLTAALAMRPQRQP